MKIKMLLPMNIFKEPQESDVFVPCPIVCVCVERWVRLCDPLPLITDCMRAWKCTSDALTGTWHSHSHSSLPGEQQCHEWITYPHKPYLKIHIFIAQEKMHWIRIQFCPTDVHSSEKSLCFPHSTQLSIWKLS